MRCSIADVRDSLASRLSAGSDGGANDENSAVVSLNRYSEFDPLD